MKRSRRISLMLLGGASLVTLTACGDDTPDPLKEAKMFVDRQQCISQYSEAECDSAIRDSRAAHVQSAPKFASRAECEAEFGAQNCEPATQTSSSSSSRSSTSTGSSSGIRSSSSSGSGGDAASTQAMAEARGGGTGGEASAGSGFGHMFIPAMVGYMMGRSMSGGLGAAPVYRDTQNNAYTGNRPLGRIDSATMAPPSKVAGTAGTPSSTTMAKASTSTASRGGFGATASSSSSSSSS